MSNNTLRDAIPKDDVIVFGHEFLSQPDPTLLERIPTIQKRNELVLPMAENGDVVILGQKPTKGFWEWLRENNMSTDNMYILNGKQGVLLPELIKGNTNLKKELEKIRGDKWYFPRFSNETDKEAAKFLGINYLGANPNLTKRFHNKAMFKELLIENNIPTLDSEIIDFKSNKKTLTKKVEKYFSYTDEAILKTLSLASGAGFITINRNNYKKKIEKINEGKYLIEPKVNIKNEFTIQNIYGTKIAKLNYTTQIVVNYAHTGNRLLREGEAPQELIKIDDEIIEKIIKPNKFTSAYGIDTIQTIDNQIYVLEMNARPTGSMPASNLLSLINKKNNTEHIANYMTFFLPKKMNFEELVNKYEQIMYTKETTTGLIPMKVSELENKGFFQGAVVGENRAQINLILEQMLNQGIKVKR